MFVLGFLCYFLELLVDENQMTFEKLEEFILIYSKLLHDGMVPDIIAEVETFVVPLNILKIVSLQLLHKSQHEMLDIYTEMLSTINLQLIDDLVFKQLLRKILHFLLIRIESWSSYVNQHKKRVSKFAGGAKYKYFHI